MTLPRLNRALILEDPTPSYDGAGGVSMTWTALGTLWGEVTARSGTERREAGQGVSATSYRIVVRGAPVGDPARPGPDQRFRDGSRIYQIRAVTERDPSGHYLICFADEEVAV